MSSNISFINIDNDEPEIERELCNLDIFTGPEPCQVNTYCKLIHRNVI